MRFEFIFVHRKVWPIQVSCRVLGVSRDGYYSWVRSKPKREEGYEKDKRIIEAATRAREEFHRVYGEPRIRISLEREGLQLSKSRLCRLLKMAEIVGTAGLRKKNGTTRASKKDIRPKDHEFGYEPVNYCQGSETVFEASPH